MAYYWSVYPVSEEFATPTETWVVTGEQTAQAILRCSWSIRHLVIQDILSNRREWPLATLGGLRLRAVGIEVNMVPSCEIALTIGQTIIYDHVLLTVTYSSSMIEPQAITEVFEPFVEMLVLDYRKFRWRDEANDVGAMLTEPEAPAFQMRGGKLTRTIYGLKANLSSSIISKMGKCNNIAYSSIRLGGITFSPESLLYFNPSISNSVSVGGERLYDVTLEFGWKEQGWNKYWKADEQAWRRIVVYATGEDYYQYPLVDLTDLLY